MKLDAKFLKKFYIQEQPTGTVDGVNTTFTLSQTPHEPDAVELYQNGLKLIRGTDYSLSSVTITMTVAPALGQKLYVYYTQLQGGA